MHSLAIHAEDLLIHLGELRGSRCEPAVVSVELLVVESLTAVYAALFLQNSAILRQEYERVARGERLPPMDVRRFELEPPGLAERNKPEAWKSALENAEAQLEHQSLRLLNLELMLKYAPNAWRMHGQNLEATDARLQGLLDQCKVRHWVLHSIVRGCMG